MQSKENYKVDSSISTKDIYAALYEKIPTVLPEFGFIKRGDHYVSSTGCKLDGGEGKQGKVYVYENNPGLIVDYTRGNVSIWEYIAQSEGLKSKEVFGYLTAAAGIKEYFDEKYEILRSSCQDRKKSKTKSDQEEKERKVSTDLWQKVYDFTLNKMEIKNNPKSIDSTNMVQQMISQDHYLESTLFIIFCVN